VLLVPLMIEILDANHVISRNSAPLLKSIRSPGASHRFGLSYVWTRDLPRSGPAARGREIGCREPV